MRLTGWYSLTYCHPYLWLWYILVSNHYPKLQLQVHTTDKLAKMQLYLHIYILRYTLIIQKYLVILVWVWVSLLAKGFDIDADRRNILSITWFRGYDNQIKIRQTENKRKHKYEKTSMPPSLGAWNLNKRIYIIIFT